MPPRRATIRKISGANARRTCIGSSRSTKSLEWNFPFAKWFVGGKINASLQLPRSPSDGPRRNKAALIWEGEPGDSRMLTYQMLADEVARCANALKSLGVKDGDRVAIYMPLVPEAAIAMLACARIGAIHSVVFGGFSAEALADRINDAEAKSVSPPTPDGAAGKSSSSRTTSMRR